MNIPIVSNNFLEEFDTNFDTDMLDLYKLQNTLEIQNVMNTEKEMFSEQKKSMRSMNCCCQKLASMTTRMKTL